MIQGRAYVDMYTGEDNQYAGIMTLAPRDPAEHYTHVYPQSGATYPYQRFCMDVPDDGHWALTLTRGSVQGRVLLHDGTPLVRVADQSTIRMRYHTQEMTKWYNDDYLDTAGGFSLSPMPIAPTESTCGIAGNTSSTSARTSGRARTWAPSGRKTIPRSWMATRSATGP